MIAEMKLLEQEGANCAWRSDLSVLHIHTSTLCHTNARVGGCVGNHRVTDTGITGTVRYSRV
jgi:hypothetical protein